MSACKRKGLFSDFDDATAEVVDLNEKLATYREVIATAKAGKKKGTTVEPTADVEESVKERESPYRRRQVPLGQDCRSPVRYSPVDRSTGERTRASKEEGPQVIR